MSSDTGDTRVVPFVIPANPLSIDLSAQSGPFGKAGGNQQFLEMLFGDQWDQVLVTSFTRDPADPTAPREDWNAWPAGQVLGNPNFDKGNTYFCPSLLTPGTRDRRVDHFRQFNVIIIDDVGTKVSIHDAWHALGVRPSYVIETSPGNYQVGWKIEPETDLAWVKGILVQLSGALWDKADNLTNPVAWRRLPRGFNTKAKLVQDFGPKGWAVELRKLYPDEMIRRLDWLHIADKIGDITPQTTLDREVGSGAKPDDLVLAGDPVYRALETGGYILGEKLTSDKHWAVTIKCPWVSEHGPTRPLTGAEYVPVTSDRHGGWFKCFHCENRDHAAFREKLDEVLRADGAKIVATFDFDPIDPATLPAGGDPAVPKLAGYEGTEDGVALAFADKYEGLLRFDHMRGGWFCWTGGFWREDGVEHAYDWARDLVRAYRSQLHDATLGHVRTVGKYTFAKAIELFARTDKKLAVDGLSWDQDPWLIGAPGCEIDLHTGEILPPDPAHGVTKQLLVRPQAMPTPLWDQFLWDSTGGDPEMIQFLQAWSGYSLTGDVAEEKFVFIYGPGGNGKGTFLHTTSAILNDYAARADTDMFMVRKYQAHTEEVARLAGVRSVTTSEIQQGNTFNVVRLKDFTGRDGKLSGRFMRQNTFTFTPQFKVTFVGNNQPRLTDVDDAMRRRIILVPFTQTPAKADITLKDRLVAEYPGILSWMIEGETLRRTKGGLAPLVPAAATLATEEYLAEQDTLKTWANERCVFGPNEHMGVAMALEDYRSWCHSRGDQTEITVQDFSRKFVDRFPSCQKNVNKLGKRLVGASLSIDTTSGG